MQTIYDLAVQFWGIWLMLLFAGIVAWAYWPGRKREMEDRAQIPFREEDDATGPAGGGNHAH